MMDILTASTAHLISPDHHWQAQYLDLLHDWNATGEKKIPFVLDYDPSDFTAMLQKLKNEQNGIGIPETFVPHSTYWLVHEEKIVGVVNIRHRLTDFLLVRGGHIGYGIRPSARNRGFAAQILALSLQKASDMGIDRVLVTCDKDNIGSAKTILKNGGVLESEETESTGNIIQRYWIQL